MIWTSMADISIHPWSNVNEIDYQVIVDVLRFDADTNNQVVLSAHWIINGKSGQDTLYKQKSLITEQASSNDYASLVSTQSKVTEKLSQEIANKLEELIKQDN